MAVGPNFNDPETQAALQAQGGQVQGTPAVETADVKPQEPQKPETTTGDAPSTSMDIDMGDQTTQAPETNEQPAATVETQEDPATKQTEMSEETLKDAGFEMKDLIEKVRENDGVVPDDIKSALAEKFEQSAIDTAVADVEGQFAKSKNVDSMNSYIYESLAKGDAEKGQENFKVLSDWCKDNMDKGEIAAINHLLASDNKDVVRQGLTQAVTAWKKGQEKPMMTGDAMATHNQAPAPKFQPLTRDEYIKVQCTEKYQSDLEYKAEIDLRRSKTLEQHGTGFHTPEYSATRPPLR